ncbi:MAG: hypothetical protein H0W16_01305, partial [Actinobacteria bacterium]|nr:hypothetical protein [Actinomycetota bacterium]
MSRRVDALRALADDHGFADFRAEAQILGGWALAESGEPERGLAELE